ncbi:MAG: hypothetical protein IKI29_06140 [Clostridia bacterium]|nr:hypothetical protein [Clostridia bacterium]
MVWLFSQKNSTSASRLATALFANGAGLTKKVADDFSVLFGQTVPNSLPKNGLLVLTEECQQPPPSSLPKNWLGLCEDCNQTALSLFQQLNLPVLTCGLCSKSTVTVSSLQGNNWIVSLQRGFQDINQNTVEPCEYCIGVKQPISPFIATAATAILLYHHIVPKFL